MNASMPVCPLAITRRRRLRTLTSPDPSRQAAAEHPGNVSGWVGARGIGRRTWWVRNLSKD